MNWPRDLVARRPNGATIRQPCEDEQAVWDSIRRLGAHVPTDATWKVQAARQPGSQVVEDE